MDSYCLIFQGMSTLRGPVESNFDANKPITLNQKVFLVFCKQLCSHIKRSLKIQVYLDKKM